MQNKTTEAFDERAEGATLVALQTYSLAKTGKPGYSKESQMLADLVCDALRRMNKIGGNVRGTIDRAEQQVLDDINAGAPPLYPD